MSLIYTSKEYSLKNDHLSTEISQFYKKKVACGFECCTSLNKIQSNKKNVYFIPSPKTFRYHHIFSNTILTQSLLRLLPEQISRELNHFIKNSSQNLFVFQDLISDQVLPVKSRSEEACFKEILMFYQAHRPDFSFTLDPEPEPIVDNTYDYRQHIETEINGIFYCTYYSTGYVKSDDIKYNVVGIDNVNRAVWGDTVYFEEVKQENNQEFDGLDGYHEWWKKKQDSSQNCPNNNERFARITGIKSRRIQMLIGNEVDTTRTYSVKHGEDKFKEDKFENNSELLLVKPLGKKFPPILVLKTEYDQEKINKYVISDWPGHSKYPIARKVPIEHNFSLDPEMTVKFSKYTTDMDYQSNSNRKKVIDSLLEMYSINPFSNTNLDLSNRNEHEQVNWEEIKLLHTEKLRNENIHIESSSTHSEQVLLSTEHPTNKEKIIELLHDINPHRLDLTELKIISIDPPGCTDIDDCLSIERLDEITPSTEKIEESSRIMNKCKKYKPVEKFTENRIDEDLNYQKKTVKKNKTKLYRIGVHIADVSSFIPSKSICNSEAESRSTTVYLNQARIDMIPEIFSSDLCSLRSGEMRLAMSAFIEIEVIENADRVTENKKDPSNFTIKIKKVQISESIINSSASLTYQQADDILSDPTNKLYENLTDLHFLSTILKSERMKNGAVNINSREARVSTIQEDKNKRSLSLENKRSLRSNSLIEEMMILANKVIGEYVKENSTNWILRKHDRSDMEADISLDSNMENKESPLKNALVIRSMKKALYTTKYPIHHTGLALPCYTHFTSPIRRYPDLQIHRIIKSIIYNIDYSINIDTFLMNKKSRDSQIVSRECNEEFIYWYMVEQEKYTEMTEFESLNEKMSKNSVGKGVKRNHLNESTENKSLSGKKKLTAYKMRSVQINNQYFTLIYLEEFDIDGIIAGETTETVLEVKWVRDDYWWHVMGWMKFEAI